MKLSVLNTALYPVGSVDPPDAEPCRKGDDAHPVPEHQAWWEEYYGHTKELDTRIGIIEEEYPLWGVYLIGSQSAILLARTTSHAEAHISADAIRLAFRRR